MGWAQLGGLCVPDQSYPCAWTSAGMFGIWESQLRHTVVNIFPTHEWRLHIEVAVGLLSAEGKRKLTLEIKEEIEERIDSSF